MPTISGQIIINENVNVSAGEIYSDTHISSGGRVRVQSDGVMQVTEVVSGAELYLSQGAAATSTTVGVNGTVRISGGEMNDTTIREGYIYLSGGAINGATANWGGRVYVSSGGVANDITMSEGNTELHVSSGGEVNRVTKTNWGGIRIEGGASANFITVTGEGDLTVGDGGVANSTTVGSRGYLIVYGTANNTIVEASGRMYLDCQSVISAAEVELEVHAFFKKRGIFYQHGVIPFVCKEVSRRILHRYSCTDDIQDVIVLGHLEFGSERHVLSE